MSRLVHHSAGHDLQRDKMLRIVFFDFDKTLCTEDSFRTFTRLIAPTIFGRFLMLMLAALCRVGVLSNATYKRVILENYWLTLPEITRNSNVNSFVHVLRDRLNTELVQRLLEHKANNDIVCVLSASPEDYLVPLFKTIAADIAVFGSTFVDDGQTCVFRNLHGREKALFAQKLIKRAPPPFEVIAYSDHHSDLPLFELASKAFLVNPSAKLVRLMETSRVPFQIIRQK